MKAARDTWNKALAWAAKNERRLGAALFAFGFLTDFFTFGLLPVEIVNYIFLGYIALALICALGAQLFAEVKEDAPYSHRALSIIFPLGVQYAFGGLLSGFVVFYTAHSVIQASWPFLLFVVLIYIGNEYFRMYKHYFVFQMTLLFFCLYAYALFALPLLIGKLGPFIFLGSTLLASGAFILFVRFLYFINRKRVTESLKTLAVSSSLIVLVVTGAYFGGFIPPIPLALAKGSVHQVLTRSGDSYRAFSEPSPAWFFLGPRTAHLTSGQELYAFSSVHAPIRFASVVVHRWERRDAKAGWVTESKISFPISGGREGGYRGYSVKSNPEAGAWRVSVETLTGQVIGRIRFDIQRTSEAPALVEEIF